MSNSSHRQDLAAEDTLDATAGDLARIDTAPADRDVPRDDGPGTLARTLDASSGDLVRPQPPVGSEDSDDPSAPSGRGAPKLPRTLGRYHILERLGAGGMGVVFAAYDPDLDRKVAVKVLRYDRGSPDSQARLLREAQALARVSHPNVVQIHDASVVGEHLFIAMEFVRGQDLRSWLAAERRPDSEILRVFLDAGRGLAAAHAEGLVHRDFKPDNVLVGAEGRARVADFGLARAGHDSDAAPSDDPGGSPPQGPLAAALTLTGTMLGTPGYMSPEQHMGRHADARSDQFSFCVALWEALYRQRPFAGHNLAQARMAVLSGQLRPPPADSRVPRRIAAILRRGLMTSPEQRYPDMNALLAALARDPSRARRRGLAVAALLVLSTGTAFFVAERRAAEASACSGAAAELAGTWNAERRAAIAAAAAPDVSARVVTGLDAYAARWAASHRDACLDHRRGELPAVQFDARVRCLERRRLALASAVAVLTAPEPAPDPAQVVARMPSLRACADAELALSEATLPEDPVLARAVRDLEARLIDARTRYHAGDVDDAHVASEAAVAEARRLEFRPLLAEALLLLAQIRESMWDDARGREAVDEAAAHALATRRDDLVAEALARRIFFDGRLAEFERALAGAPMARAAAERLPEPALALARLENNLGTLFFMQRDLDGARPYFERATDALERAPDVDPIERSNYWKNLALTTRAPAARERAFLRAATSLEGQLGERHLLALDLRLARGLYAPDAQAGAALLGELCPRYPELYPDASISCAHCFQTLGHLQSTVGELERANRAFARVEACLEDSATEQAQAEQFAAMRHRAAAFAALLRDRGPAALAHADAALARSEPYKSMWWVAAEIAELELARGRALLTMGRVDQARAALERAIPVFEDMNRINPTALAPIWLADARALLARLPAVP